MHPPIKIKTDKSEPVQTIIFLFLQMKIKNEVNKQFNLFCWNTFFSTLFCFHFFCHSIIAIYFWFLFFELFSFYSFFSIFFSISSWILSFEISSYVFLCFLFRLSFNAYNFCTLTYQMAFNYLLFFYSFSLWPGIWKQYATNNSLTLTLTQTHPIHVISFHAHVYHFLLISRFKNIINPFSSPITQLQSVEQGSNTQFSTHHSLVENHRAKTNSFFNLHIIFNFFSIIFSWFCIFLSFGILLIDFFVGFILYYFISAHAFIHTLSKSTAKFGI